MPNFLYTDDEADYVPDVFSGKPQAGFKRAEKAGATEELDAKFETVSFLESLGASSDEEVVSDIERGVAQDAFKAFTTPTSLAERKEAISKADTPNAVKQIVGMLAAYDWQFVDEANKIRGFVVSQLLTEAEQHPDAKIRIRALELLGKVTEVALFTDRVEVKREELSDDELEKRIKDKLGKYMGAANVVDAEFRELESKRTDAEDAEFNP